MCSKLGLDVISWALFLIISESVPEGLLLQSTMKKIKVPIIIGPSTTEVTALL